MLSDVLNFIGKLSFRKLLNILIVQFSFALSNLLKRPLVWGKPWFVSVESTSVCNLSCPQCPVGIGDISRNKKFMDINDYKLLIEEISGTVAMLSLYFQGEPLMHKEFAEFVRLAKEYNIYTQTSTNGQLLSEDVCRELVEAGLDRIIVSIDGTDQQSYQTYRRGGDLQKVTDGIGILNRVRQEAGSKKPLIIVQFLVFRHNHHQASQVKTIAGQWGADRVWLKSVQVEYPDSADEWIPEEPDHSRYNRNTTGNWVLKRKLRNRCKRLWQTTVITSDGLIVPCCFDKRATYSMGSAGEERIARIWKSRSYQDFRRQVLSNRKEIAICRNCTEGIGRIFS